LIRKCIPFYPCREAAGGRARRSCPTNAG
jgi:hypothetical protein